MVRIGKGVLLFGGGPSRFEYTDETFTYGSRPDTWKRVASCRDREGGDGEELTRRAVRRAL